MDRACGRRLFPREHSRLLIPPAHANTCRSVRRHCGTPVARLCIRYHSKRGPDKFPSWRIFRAAVRSCETHTHRNAREVLRAAAY
jgi:hypothetical protein